MEISKVGKLIYIVRGQRVLLDSDLAALYGVATGNLNKAVARNAARFPPDFMFRLTREEYRSLRFQNGILKRGQHAKFLPRVFTEQGVAMLSGALNSERAVSVNVAIMRAFVRLRQVLATHKEFAERLDRIERGVGAHDGRLLEQAGQIDEIFEALRRLMDSPRRRKMRIGFVSVEK